MVTVKRLAAVWDVIPVIIAIHKWVFIELFVMSKSIGISWNF